MRIKQKYEKILDECIETIYNCSMDTSNNKALVDDNSKIINFDMVTKKYSTQNLIKNNYPQSIDSLYINENIDAIFFIEFKNKHKIEKVGIKNKIYSSVYILMDIFNLTTDFVRDNIQFILVYMLLYTIDFTTIFNAFSINRSAPFCVRLKKHCFCLRPFRMAQINRTHDSAISDW